MIDFSLPATWAAISLGVATLGWFIRLERRLSAFVTREEANGQTEQQQTHLAGQLREINDKLDAQNSSASTHRDTVTSQLHEIALDMVAVQAQIGAPRRRKVQRSGGK